MDALTENGYVDDAWRLITREEYPSIGYMLQQEATTIWERFELKKTPGMNSHNHPMYGAVGYWFYAYIAGVRPTAPGFAEADIRPFFPEALQSASAVLDTVRGELSCLLYTSPPTPPSPSRRGTPPVLFRHGAKEP